MNRLEMALKGTDEELDFYLSDVGKSEFRDDIADIKRKVMNKGAIKEAIKMLQGMVDA